MTTAGIPAATPRPVAAKLVIPLLAGAAVAVLLGVYGKQHDPTLEQPYTLFFTATINLKVWFASIAVLFALVQILTALRIYGKVKIPRTEPSWLGSFHRLSGTLAFGFTLPVAYQCLWGLGFQSATTRVLIHSITGCFLYGAIAVKVLFVRERGLPGWVIPVAGGFVFAAFVVVWWTSAVWFFQNYGDLGLELF
ncbi:MAG: DUF6529 family protein [Acidimicrobiia bacterium]